MIRVMVIAHQALIREGLRLLVDGEKDMRVACAAGKVREALGQSGAASSHVALVDVDAPEIELSSMSRIIRNRATRAEIVVLASRWSDELIAQALEHDILGFVLKADSFATVREAIRSARAGNHFYSRRARARIVSQSTYVATGDGQTRLQLLTQRERQLLRLLASGLTLKKACASLGVSYKTADKHKVNLMKKLDIHDRVELARYAIREGIIEA